ncbi:hypothetical protein E2C01_001646 [Portunus trituberculatus]|uniref:Uncharacterized protein n=1 Tax=Portunus trituberculatus TaxID=210409 RepID=A0A5B7CJY5_PORTR|nr:hypothetical protein [Portunus trituberculatus]
MGRERRAYLSRPHRFPSRPSPSRVTYYAVEHSPSLHYRPSPSSSTVHYQPIGGAQLSGATPLRPPFSLLRHLHTRHTAQASRSLSLGELTDVRRKKGEKISCARVNRMSRPRPLLRLLPGGMTWEGQQTPRRSPPSALDEERLSRES